MRRITMLALVAVLALIGAACGDDDDSGGEDTEATTDDTASDDTATDDGSGDDDGATDAATGLVDEDCQFLLEGGYLNPLSELVPGGAAEEVEETSTRLEAIAAEAPEEIQDAMDVLVDGFAAMREAVADIDLSDPQSFVDPEVRERLDELEDTFDETYEEAAETVSTYIDENCTPGS